MEPVIGQALFESLRILRAAADTLRTKCVQGITANEEVCRAYVENSIGIVTYLNPFIGHHNGDVVAKEALATGKSVRDLVLKRSCWMRRLWAGCCLRKTSCTRNSGAPSTWIRRISQEA